MPTNVSSWLAQLTDLSDLTHSIRFITDLSDESSKAITGGSSFFFHLLFPILACFVATCYVGSIGDVLFLSLSISRSAGFGVLVLLVLGYDTIRRYVLWEFCYFLYLLKMFCFSWMRFTPHAVRGMLILAMI